jgi:hypothetical protein
MLMFGILDRYIGRTVIMAIMMCTITLVGLSSLIKFVDQLQNVGEGNFTTLHAILRVIYAIPSDIVLFFPMAALLGGVMAALRTGWPSMRKVRRKASTPWSNQRCMEVANSSPPALVMAR